ncbi:uncharacterized protein LOC128284400 isoform X2 [Gossypium arboreum]|uniref:uncharacterized protein LOC128284400 isoform X2 n=1 Tax=Gossypium arboreum TaxID=29729 RepID=UPI0022F17781|nr:uncharacterized protein LOC128284400 isoform X2 [Gossypium arboreum]
MKRLPQLEERCRKDIGAGWHKIAHIATVCNHRRLLVKRIWQIHESKCRKKNCLFPIPTRNDRLLLFKHEFNGRAKKQDMHSSSADLSMLILELVYIDDLWT